MKTIISFATRFSLLLDKHDQRIETIGNDESTVVISIIESSNHRIIERDLMRVIRGFLHPRVRFICSSVRARDREKNDLSM